MVRGHIVKLLGILRLKIRREAPRHGGYLEIYIKRTWIVEKVYFSNILDGRLTASQHRMLECCESLRMGSNFKYCSIKVV